MPARRSCDQRRRRSQTWSAASTCGRASPLRMIGCRRGFTVNWRRRGIGSRKTKWNSCCGITTGCGDGTRWADREAFWGASGLGRGYAAEWSAPQRRIVAPLIVHGEALPFSGGAVESAGGLFLIEDKVVAPDALCFADHPAFSERTPERRPSWPRPILRKSARRFIVYL